MSDPFGLVAIGGAVNGGVYYTPNFTLMGAISWSRLTTTGLGNLLIQWMAVDPYNPLNRQYVLTNESGRSGNKGSNLYTRDGGNWSSIMTTAQAVILTGETPGPDVNLISPWCDPTVEGSIYVGFDPDSASYSVYILKSLDYGANWSVITDPKDGPIFELQVYGNNIWMALNTNTPTIFRIHYSANGGAAWVISNNYGSFASGLQVKYPHSQIVCYWGDPSIELGRFTYAVGAIEPYTQLQPGDGLGSNYIGRVSGDVHWIDYYTNNHERLLDGQVLQYTTDAWATYSSTNTGLSANLSANTSIHNTTDQDAVIFGQFGAAASNIYAMVNETAAATSRNGVGPNNVPTTEALAVYGIWVGYSPASFGAYVYADEQGDITDIPDPDNLGIPMFGDRSSWRDFDADDDGDGTPLADYHAQDIREDTPQRHAPWSVPAPAADYGIVSDGTKWVISSDEMALQSDLHDPVTLDADAAILLDLQGAGGQEIGLDTQAANLVFAGPAAGPANEPTFRALVSADLPAIALNDLSDVNTAGVADGDAILYDQATATWLPGSGGVSASTLHGHVTNEDHSAECDGSEDEFSTILDFLSGTTAVYLNGIRQRLNVHYTEDVTLDGITFVTPPEADDELVIDYLISYSDWVALIGGLSDSDNIALADSDNVLLNDSL